MSLKNSSHFKVLLVLGLLFAGCFVAPQKTQAQYEYQGEEWYINEFKTEVTLTQKDVIEIKETLRVYFNVEKHGIIRDIPERYDSTNPIVPNETRPVDIKSVTDENGNSLTYEVSSSNDYKHVKIGDADTLISGEQTYVIEYTIARALLFFEENDELYLNITGVDWPVEIKAASAVIKVPFVDSTEGWEAICYTGPLDSSNKDCTIQNDNKGSISVVSNNPLPAYSGMAVAVKLPKGLVQEPSFFEKYGMQIIYNLGILLPIPVFIFIYDFWKRNGKDPALKVIKPEFYRPKDILPGEAGVLIDNRADVVDISATIIDLAIRGYLKIEESEKKLFGGNQYTFILTNKDETDLATHEKLILEGLRVKADGENRVKLSSLKNDFYKTALTIQEQLYTQVVEKQYYAKDPRSLTKAMVTIGSIVGAGTLFYAMPTLSSVGAFGTALGLFVSAGIVLAFSPFMPKRTEKGTQKYEYILGMKQYIHIAEKDRIKMMQSPDSPYVKAPDNTIELFEQLLPYAIVMHEETAWGDKFKDIYSQPPDWYAGSNMSAFNTGYLISSLNSATTSMNSTLTSTPRTSSGGFSSGFSGGSSSGGSGGGGGSSW